MTTVEETLEIVVKLVVVAGFVAVVWYALQPRFVFLVRIEDGALRVTRGKVSAPCLLEMEDACARNGVRRGWIGGVARGRNTALTFSRSIPPPCRQQLRNLWVMQR